MRYQFGEFVLDTDNYQLLENDRPVELRAKAFHVLAFLLKNRHRMVSKEELLDEVWHKQFIADSTLNSCIKTVRRTLHDDGQQQRVVQTVRARGYRFVAPVNLVKSDGAVQRTISKRLGERFDKTFVGRDSELNLILDALAAPALPFWVCFLFGSGGIGKTSILRNLCRKIDGKHPSIFIDCREIEPTPEGLLHRLAESLRQWNVATKSDNDECSLREIAGLLADCGTRVLLCLDQFESFTISESWIRQEFFPALPDTVLTVIASRQSPRPAWYASAEWAGSFRMLEIGELSESESRSMLESRNLDTDQIERIQNFARGYPLALELAAMLYRAQPDSQISGDLAPLEVVAQLATSVLRGLPDVEKEAVEGISTVHRANEPILCALLGLRDARDLFLKLRELPFVGSSDLGIALHDVVRDAIAKDLRFRDPDRYRIYQRNAWKYYRDESRDADSRKLWSLTADLLYLIESPVIRNAYFPEGGTDYAVQPALPSDAKEIMAIARRHDPESTARALGEWLRRHPEHFYVARTTNEQVIAGFEVFFSPSAVDPQQLRDDPVTAVWRRHLDSNPVGEHESVLFFRRFLSRDRGDAPSPVQGTFWIDIKRVYMQMRPNLRRLYIALNHLAPYELVCRSLGFVVLDECRIDCDHLEFHTIMVDFGERSIDGWLVQLVRRQLDGNRETDAPPMWSTNRS